MRAGYFGARRPFISRKNASASGFSNPPSAATPEVGFSFSRLALRQPRDAATTINAGQSRVEFQRLIVIRDRPREIPLRKPDHTAIAPGFGQFRIERERMVQIVQRPFYCALRQPCPAAIAVGVRLLRSESDGAVEIGERAIRLRKGTVGL